jgi:hypothetical protein
VSVRHVLTPPAGRSRSRLRREWKLDVSLFVAGVPPDLGALGDELRGRLSDETRRTILTLKDAWFEQEAYPDVVAAYEIYDAVLNHGVTSLDQLDAYLLERGLSPARSNGTASR